MTDTKLIPSRVIVDRTVLASLLQYAAGCSAQQGNFEQMVRLGALYEQVESGQRVELYADSFPLKSKE